MLKNKIIVSVFVLVLAVGILVGYKLIKKSQTQEGIKEITVEVVVGEEVKSVTFKTSKTMLGEALIEQKLIKTESSTYGRYVVGVKDLASNDGSFIEVDFEKDGTFWFIYINGTAAEVGIDDYAIKDGDVIRFELQGGNE
ncbi:MAG: DUF4430 domain-containing protein [Bacilli bacterium]|nr:DUF4430 domain-containing protein [Bacilli bacterium]